MNRRGLILSGLSLLATPAIVQARNLMPVRVPYHSKIYTLGGDNFTAEFYYDTVKGLLHTRMQSGNWVVVQSHKLNSIPYPFALRPRP